MLGNWIRQTTTTTGTGNLTLAAVSGYPTFADEFATSERFAYAIVDDSTGAPLERGIGYLNGTPELVRESVLATYASSAYTGANPSAVSLASGTKRVICAAGAHSLMAAVPGVWANAAKVYGDVHLAAAGASLTVTADRAYAVPFRAQADADIDAVHFRVSTVGASGKSAITGVFSVGRDGLPGVLLAQGSTIDVSSVGGTGLKASTFTRFRPPPRFFVAFLSDGAPVMDGWATGLVAAETLGGGASTALCPFIHHVGATGLAFPSSWTGVANASNATRPHLTVRMP